MANKSGFLNKLPPKSGHMMTIVFLAAGFFSLGIGYSANEDLIDRLVAIVGGQPITHSAVTQKVTKGPLVSLSEFPAKKGAKPFDIALNDLINMTLVEIESEKIGIEITEENLTEEITSFAKKKNLTLEKLKEILESQNMPFETYKKDFKNQLLISKFQGRVILPLVNVTEKDIEVYLLKTSGENQTNTKLKLRKLFIAINDNQSDIIKKTKKDLIEKIYNDLNNGLVFSEAVKVYSDSAFDRESGGLIPSVPLKDLSPPFRSAVKSLEEGDITKPIELASGYFIFKLEKKYIDQGKEYQAQKRKAEFVIRKDKATRQLQRWIEIQRRKTRINILKD